MIRVANVLADARLGGPPRRVGMVASRLRKRGIQTLVCLPRAEGGAASWLRKKGLEVKLLPMAPLPKLWNPWRFVKWVFCWPLELWSFLAHFRSQQPDLVHINGALNIGPALAARLAGRPVLWHLNDTLLPPYLARVFGLGVRALASQVSAAAVAVARYYGLSEENCAILYAPVDRSQFRPASARRRRSGKKPVVLGTVANWNPAKGLDILIPALARIREHWDEPIQLVLAGARLKTQTAYAQKLDQLIESLELTNSIQEVGFVEKAWTVYQKLDLFVLASRSEACPMVVLEAMACGVPVVATDVGGVRELVMDGPEPACGLVVPPEDPKALSQAILNLLKNSRKRARLGTQGVIRSRKFDVKNIAQNHEKIYREMLNPHKS